MHPVGRIIELWRYPVSSVRGEMVGSTRLSAEGVEGDRGFLLFDSLTGKAAAPESDPRWRPALRLSATLGDGALPEIGFPDEERLALDAASLGARLADHFGFPVSVGASTHGAPSTGFPVMEPRYRASPVHLITTASLQALDGLVAAKDVDSRRFRPTVVIETADTGSFLENAWIGAPIRLGDTRVRGAEGTRRCGMTMIAQPGIGEEPEILRTILRHNRRNFGIYCDVETPGMLRVGDAVFVTA